MFKVSATERAFQKLQALTDKGMTTPEAVKALIAADPALASEIEVEEVKGERKTIVFDAPKYAPGSSADAGTLSKALYDALELHHSKRKTQEIEEARDAELDNRLASLEKRTDVQEAVLRGSLSGLVSHLEQHNAVQSGERAQLEIGESLRVIIDNLGPDFKGDLAKSLPAPLAKALETARAQAALPATKTDEKTVDVVPTKPARKGLFG